MAKRQNFKSVARHTRLLFQPLTWSCQLECITPDSPATQVYSVVSGEFIPSRTLTPTCVRPTLVISDPDGIMTDGQRNDLLASHAWLVDGQPIADVWTAGTDYNVCSSSNSYGGYGEAYNGTLIVYKDIEPSNGVTLQYTGSFPDSRTGYDQPVRSDTMSLESVENGEDSIGLLVESKLHIYNPLADKHLLYDFLNANGGDTSGISEADLTDGTQYDRTVNVWLTSGGVKLETLPDGYAVRIVDRATGEEWDDEASLTYSYPTLTLDLRMFDDTMLEAQAVRTDDDGEETIAYREQIDIIFAMPQLESLKPRNKASLAVGQATWTNKALITTGRQIVKYPELYYDIAWFATPRVLSGTSYTYGDEKQIALGEEISVDAGELELDTSAERCWCTTRCEATERPACSVVLDEDGDALVDDDGNYLIA